MEKNMEKTNLEIRKNNRQENRRVDDIRTTSVTFDNPIWQLLEEMEEPRPYKTSDFKKEYFKGVEDLAEGFADDNPLAGSASYEIYLKDIDMQDDMVSWLGTVQGIRKINYSSDTASGLSSFNKMLGLLSAVIIAILLAVAIFLISNTITTAAAFRREENRIMRLIGATNFMIRAPFVVQGVMIGLVGALIPLAITYFLYRQAVVYMMERFDILSNLIEFIPIQTIFPSMVAVAMALGVGIGFVGSFFTIRRHLKV